MKKLFLVIAVLGFVLGFQSCLDSDSDTVVKGVTPAVINKLGATYASLLTPTWGDLQTASTLDLLNYNDKTCVYAYLEVDQEQTPKYASVATVLSVVPQKRVLLETQAATDYLLPIGGIDDLNSVFFRGMYWFEITHKESIDKKIDYQLYYNPDEINEENKVITFYLEAKKTEESAAASSYTRTFAFDLEPLFMAYGKDTSLNIGEESIAVNKLTVNVQYLNSIDADGNPVYKKIKSESYGIYNKQ